VIIAMSLNAIEPYVAEYSEKDAIDEYAAVLLLRFVVHSNWS